MSIHKRKEGLYEIRWREGGRNKSVRVHGSLELAKKIERKRMSVRDEKRHLDVRREINFRMSALIDRYWEQYGSKKRSADREKSIVEGIRRDLGKLFVREVDGVAISRWYTNLTTAKGVSEGTAVRHFHVMHHMLAKASTIWSKETGVVRNPADEVEVRRPDDARERYLSEDELRRLKAALDGKRLRKGTKDVNRTTQRMRLIVLIALTTGMRASEIFGLRWPDVMYAEGLVAVRAKLKGGKMRYVPLLPEIATELKRYPVVISDDRIFPPRKGARGVRRRLEDSELSVSRSASHLRVLVHDEWRRSL
jgi:integrase